MNYESRTTTYQADNETIMFLDNIEESMKEYWKHQGYTTEQMEDIDFRSNIHNSIVSLFRRGGRYTQTMVEYLILETSHSILGQLNNEYEEKYNTLSKQINTRIEENIKNSLEG